MDGFDGGAHDPLRLGGHLALDFLNTVTGEGEARIDAIGDGPGWIDWLRMRQVVPPSVLERLSAGPTRLARSAAEARGLREWWRAFVRRHAGRAPSVRSSAELDPINALLAQDVRQVRLEVVSGSVEWRDERQWAGPGSLLYPVAEALGEFLRDGDFRYVRHCAGLGCTRWFLDGSRGHRRRWCDMAVCGNRTKAREHRARHPGPAR
jgi:predicted RNA-binding Zn ribbon-like protein